MTDRQREVESEIYMREVDKIHREWREHAAALTDPEPARLDGCTCQPVRGSHKPPCPWSMR